MYAKESGSAESYAKTTMSAAWRREGLSRMAAKIVTEFASPSAADGDALKQNPDKVYQQQIRFNRDLLLYVVFDIAIKSGDIGLMEVLLPQILLRFVGGRNSKYAAETLELLQGLHSEWPEEIA